MQASSYAGLLLAGPDGERRLPGRARSAVLLVGRLLVSLLFLFVGLLQASRRWGGWGLGGLAWGGRRRGGVPSQRRRTCRCSSAARPPPALSCSHPTPQIQRVLARDFVLAARLPHSRLYERDGHDNNFLVRPGCSRALLPLLLLAPRGRFAAHSCLKPVVTAAACGGEGTRGRDACAGVRRAAPPTDPSLPRCSSPPYPLPTCRALHEQLVEFVLALPFAVGFKTPAVARLLAATLAAEAVVCWPFWADWPTPSYSAHVRCVQQKSSRLYFVHAGQQPPAAPASRRQGRTRFDAPCVFRPSPFPPPPAGCTSAPTCLWRAACCCWRRLERGASPLMPCCGPRRKSDVRHPAGGRGGLAPHPRRCAQEISGRPGPPRPRLAALCAAGASAPC